MASIAHAVSLVRLDIPQHDTAFVVHSEVRSNNDVVVVKPKQNGSKDVTQNQVGEEDVVNRAWSPDLENSYKREKVEHDADDREGGDGG